MLRGGFVQQVAQFVPCGHWGAAKVPLNWQRQSYWRHRLNLDKSCLILLFAFSLNVGASTQDEISHLLNFVASTDCKYERNGSFYNGEKAVEHINKKYAYYSDDIKTAEDFIKRSATKSMVSGKYYKIHCGDKKPVKSQDWLLGELKIYRQAQQ